MPPDQPSADSGRSPRERSADDAWLDAWLAHAWRQWRLWIGVHSAVIGLGAALLTRAMLAPHLTSAIPAAVAVGLVAMLVALLAAPGVRAVEPVVRATERAHPELRNALFAWVEGRGRHAPVIAARLATHARQTLDVSTPPRPLSRRAWASALVLLAVGTAAGLWVPAARDAASGGAAATVPRASGNATPAPLRWTAMVAPPAYSGRPPVRVVDATRLDVLAGSRVDVVFSGWPRGAVARLGMAPLPLVSDTGATAVRLVAVASDVVTIQAADEAPLAAITLVVTPDAPPAVRITSPAADLRRAAATGTVAIAISARDDIGLRDLRLRFTKVSGSGESFTFEDGEWPVQLRRTSATEWTGVHQVDLAALGLAAGDSVVYHAVAHDARTGPEGSAESERFLIEITRPGALAAGDFSLPEPEEKFALSQRMVIQLTERLLERRGRIGAEQFRQEAQALAIAQRRVRAEFVFMLGGEVEDEFEEAAHAHEVEAGRLDNRGQGDLTEAVRQMSQAETRLTDAAVREALPYEYRALSALQAAFGKARYFMRTLPAPVQIDPARRLQGDRGLAASSRWTVTPMPAASRAAALQLLERLEVPGVRVAGLLPELVALDRGDAAWVAQVQRTASVEGAAGLARALRARLLSSSTGWMAMPLARSAAEAALATGPGTSTPR